MEEDKRREHPDPPLRAPYRAPALIVHGPVAVLTNTLNMAGTLKDGGANNTKS